MSIAAFRLMPTVFAAALLIGTITAVPARAEYTYIHNDGEYEITLPDAPSGQTLWADQSEKLPFIKEVPKFGPIGEFATLRRTDPVAGDSFNVDVTFVKSGRDYLLGLTEEEVRSLLESQYRNQPLEKKTVGYSQGSGTLKWGTLTGFSVDRQNNLLFHACHILTGVETVTMVKVSFSADNDKFGEAYEKMKGSIKFVGTQ